MKKVNLLLTGVVALGLGALTSCGGATKTETQSEAVTTEVAEELTEAAEAVDSTLAEVVEADTLAAEVDSAAVETEAAEVDSAAVETEAAAE